MNKSRQKYYVVWKGVEPGVYASWKECQRQINGFAGALYKSFSSEAEAQLAYSSSPFEYIGKSVGKESMVSVPAGPAAYCDNALAVDAACSGNPGKMEYRGVHIASRQQIFHFGPMYGTNNIGEFLAIVHGLALLQQKGLTSMPVYSDSCNAINWVRQKKCKTKLERTAKTEELFLLIERAEKWLRTHTYANPLLKWQTDQWGEVPADFGRKG